MVSMYVCGTSGVRKRRKQTLPFLSGGNSCCAKENGQELAMPTHVGLADVLGVGEASQRRNERCAFEDSRWGKLLVRLLTRRTPCSCKHLLYEYVVDLK